MVLVNVKLEDETQFWCEFSSSTPVTQVTDTLLTIFGARDMLKRVLDRFKQIIKKLKDTKPSEEEEVVSDLTALERSTAEVEGRLDKEVVKAQTTVSIQETKECFDILLGAFKVAISAGNITEIENTDKLREDLTWNPSTYRDATKHFGIVFCSKDISQTTEEDIKFSKFVGTNEKTKVVLRLKTKEASNLDGSNKKENMLSGPSENKPISNSLSVNTSPKGNDIILVNKSKDGEISVHSGKLRQPNSEEDNILQAIASQSAGQLNFGGNSVANPASSLGMQSLNSEPEVETMYIKRGIQEIRFK